LYLLEYGSGWFTKNPDAGLSRIDYNEGNRAPVVAGIGVNKTSGALPFKVVMTVDAKDLEKNPLTYEWHLGNDIVKETKKPQLEHTFDKPGDYNIYVVVKDNENATSKSAPVSVYAGNEAPVVNIMVEGNKSFYFPGKPVAYIVSVADRDDPTIANDVNNVFVSADYVEGLDKAGASMGHQVMTETMTGKSLVQSLDCKACHKETGKSIGPSYDAVSKRYQKDPNAVSHLVNKIIKGGAGVWGEAAMPAHPNLSEGDARQIVSYIQSLSDDKQKQKSLPAIGTLQPTLGKKPMDDGLLVLSASYTDKGGPGRRPLMGSASVALQNSKLSMTAARILSGYAIMTYNNMPLMIVPKGPGSFSLDSIDLSGIYAVELTAGWEKPPRFGYAFELRLDSPGGRKIGEAVLPGGLKDIKGPGGFGGTVIKLQMMPVTDGKLHNLYLVSKALNNQEEGTLVLQSVQFRAQ
jgi:cytochrome c